MIGAAGLCLVENDNSPSVYCVHDHREHPLPTHIAGKQVVYRTDWNYPIEDIIVGYVIEKKSLSRQKNLLREKDTPNGMRCTAGVALNTEFRPLFDPIPLHIYPYKGEWTLAENYNKHYFMIDRQGKVIRKFPNDWRLDHRADNLSELIVYKSADKNANHHFFHKVHFFLRCSRRTTVGGRSGGVLCLP